MPRRTVRLGYVVVLVTVLAATTAVHAADPSSPPGSGSPTAPLASTAPVASTAPGGPMVPHDAPRLEEMLPVEVDGAPLFRTSLGPATWATLGVESLGPIGALIGEFDVDIDALTVAAANDPADPTFNLFALAVAGVPGTTLAETYARLAQQTEVGSTLAPATLGGIAVTHLEAPYNPIPNIWIWDVGDVMFGIQAADEATGAELIALLPTSVPPPVPVSSPSVAP